MAGKYPLVCGIQRTPAKVVVYGPEGIGKSTMAAQLPDPVFIDVEGGTNQLPVARMPKPTSWTMLMREVESVRDGDVPCSTIVIDTADAAERLCIESVCAKDGKDSVEDYGYGKGYVVARDEFSRLLDLLTEVTERGINAVILCHSILSKFERPDESSAYDRWSLKLIDTKRSSVAATVKEWADMVLFCDYEVTVTKTKEGKSKATGGRRVIRTTHSVTWDAKNRFGFPDTLPLDEDGIAKVSEVMTTREVSVSEDVTKQTAPATTTAKAPTATKEPAKANPKPKPKPEADPYGYPPRLKALSDLMAADHITDEELRRAVGDNGTYLPETAVVDYERGFVDWMTGKVWPKIVKKVETLRFRDEAAQVEVPFDTEGEE